MADYAHRDLDDGFAARDREPDPLHPEHVTVYSQPNCVQCNATYRALDKAGVRYSTIDVTDQPETSDFLKDLGHRQAPVVITPSGQHWSGYKPDMIKATTTSGPAEASRQAPLDQVDHAATATARTSFVTEDAYPATTKQHGWNPRVETTPASAHRSGREDDPPNIADRARSLNQVPAPAQPEPALPAPTAQRHIS